MGAWGLGLFESDHDLHIVNELNDDMNLAAADIVCRAFAHAALDQGIQQKPNEPGQIPTPHVDHKSSLYAKNSDSPDYVRWLLENKEQRMEHDSDMVCDLETFINSYTGKVQVQKSLGQPLNNPYGNAYKTVILGACFMTLGCTLPDAFLELLKDIYAEVGLMKNGMRQMEKAFSSDGFSNGTPYDFGSLGKDCLEKGNALPYPDDRLYPDSRLSNVASPADAATDEMLAKVNTPLKKQHASEKAMMKILVNERSQICNVCEASKCDDGSTLKQCSKCGLAKYCGKECQKKDFYAIHKAICQALAKIPKGSDAYVFVGGDLLSPDANVKTHIDCVSCQGLQGSETEGGEN